MGRGHLNWVVGSYPRELVGGKRWTWMDPRKDVDRRRVGVDVLERGQTETDEYKARQRRSALGGADIWSRHGRRTDASRLQGETGERRDGGEEKRRGGGGGTGDTEGTCYALRDMAEARGIHNFVKTKMLRSCLGGVAFFLVSRNVQARLSLRPSHLPSPRRLLRVLILLLPRFSLFLPPFRPPGVLLVRVTSAHHPLLVSPVMRRGMRNVL